MRLWVLRVWGEVGDDVRNSDTTRSGQNAQLHVAQLFLTAPQLAKLSTFKGTRRFISALATFIVSTQKALNKIQ